MVGVGGKGGEDGMGSRALLTGDLRPGENMLEVWVKGAELIENSAQGAVTKAASRTSLCGSRAWSGPMGRWAVQSYISLTR